MKHRPIVASYIGQHFPNPTILCYQHHLTKKNRSPHPERPRVLDQLNSEKKILSYSE